MKECTNPQYIVSATAPNYHTESFAVGPGSPPVIQNQIPPGQPTVPNGSQEQMLRAIADVLAKAGHCTIPQAPAAQEVQVSEEVEESAPESNIPSGLAALSQNMAKRNQERTQAIEEVPATPNVYLDKVESIGATGTGVPPLAAVFAVPIVVLGGRMILVRVQQNMFPTTITPEVQNHEDEQPEHIYQRPQPTASVSAVPAHEPSPWTRTAVYAGNARQQGDFGRNEEPKWTRNESEMSRNGFRNESKRVEMDSEMTSISPEMSLSDPERLDRVRSRLSGLYKTPETVATQVISESISPEMKTVSGYFDPAGDLFEAKQVYFGLRSRGINTATDLGGAIFGIRGGDKWASVSPILREWSNEWEQQSGQLSS